MAKHNLEVIGKPVFIIYKCTNNQGQASKVCSKPSPLEAQYLSVHLP